ncbi:unnamed protein product [Parnassius mnemosyne]|uniref:Reverse transcriptase domain-containing protein n=1 Tax=Parnassius mnemosyne TaxID=213953 RepID=A0AAV1LI17_9NEOP
MDYERAFDSAEIWAVLQSLQWCQVDCRATMAIRVQNPNTKPIQLQRGVRLGDVISPKLHCRIGRHFQATGLERIRYRRPWRVHHSLSNCRRFSLYGRIAGGPKHYAQ